MKSFWQLIKKWKIRLLIFLTIFGPATITAMADNDANGVTTYAIAGAKLGYPILFVLFWVTILLAITQEMGMRMSLVTRKGLGDVIREYFGIHSAIFIFIFLFISNIGVIVVNMSAFKITAQLLNLPVIPLILGMVIVSFIFVAKGNYKLTQNIMLLSSLFFISYIFSAFKSNPDWSLAFKNIIWPRVSHFDASYWKTYIVIGLGVLGTTITPWGQFFISSFGLDKKIHPQKLKYSQLETYWGAFLTDFFSFFMIVATAATLFAHKIVLVDGNQAAKAIEPFAGHLAATLYALGILNAGFMGIVVVSLATTYAFSEFFGYSGGLDQSFKQSRTFYMLFGLQLIIGFFIVMIPSIDLFKIAIVGQIINAMVLPFIFYFLIKFTNQTKYMGKYANNSFQKWFAIIGTIIIILASIFTIISTFFKF